MELVRLLPLVAIALLFWLMIIRPQARRQRAVAQMQSGLRVGDEVVLASGIYGVLREVNDADVRVQVADNVVIRVARAAVASVTTDGQTNPGQTGPEQTDGER